MRRESKTRMVEITDVTYIAYDGKEFTNEEDCKAYERGEERKDFIAKSEKLMIEELNDTIPLVLDETVEYHNYRWYKLKDKNDYDILTKIYSDNYFNEPTSYPAIMCVEVYDYYTDLHDGTACGWTLDDCKADTIKFWKRHGYKVTIEKE